MTEAHWAGAAAAVVDKLETTELPQRLAEMLRQVSRFDHMVVFGYRGTARPIDLFDDFPASKRKVFVTDYQAGPYLLDPFYLAAVRSAAPGLYRLRDMAPDRFYQGEYFRNYYVQTGLAEEIAYFVDLPEQASLVLSLMRTDRPFLQREFLALQAMFPFVDAVVRRQWRAVSRQFGPDARSSGSQRPRQRMEFDFGRFGEGVLTPREREVAEFTLKGHSAESVGQILGISPGTVRIHRRNIYSKLRINSQGELFSRFLETLGDLA